VRFRDRADAGRHLGRGLRALRGEPDLLMPDLLVLGLPRGGVVVAAEVARELAAPLDVLVVRKVGFPGHEELAVGAVASGGVSVRNEDLLARTGLDGEEVARREALGHVAVAELEGRLRGSRPPPDLKGRVVVLVDDGMATGATMRVAIVAARRAGARRVVAAVPVGSPEAVDELAAVADDVVCLSAPARFDAVGRYYRDFAPVEERTVRSLLVPLSDD